MAHSRRKFYELADIAASKRRGKNAPPISPLVLEAVQRIDLLFDIERGIVGESAEHLLAVRKELSAPVLADLKDWMQAERDAYVTTTIRPLYASDHRTTTIHLPRHISPQPRLPIVAQPSLGYAHDEDGEYYLDFFSLDTALARTAGDLATGSFSDWQPLHETHPDPRRALVTWTGEGLDWTRIIELVDPDYIF